MSFYFHQDQTLESYIDTLRASGLNIDGVYKLNENSLDVTSEFLYLPDLVAVCRQLTAPIIWEGSSSDKHIILYFKQGIDTLVCNDELIKNASSMIYTPSTRSFCRTDPQCKMYQVWIPVAFFNRHFKENQDQIINRDFLITPECLVHSKRITQQIRYYLDANEVLNPQALIDIQSNLMTEIEALFDSATQFKRKKIEKRRSSIFRRAIDYINLQSGRPLTSHDLAAEVFCSVRTLEYTFKEYLNISPKQYIKIRRMHDIRRLLQIPTKYSVNQLLRNYGVTNVSRFCKDYKMLFSESPLETVSSNRR